MGVESPTGDVVGGFRVGVLLARGATGAVYLAEDAGGRRVALKLLAPELAHDERFRQRFLRESQLAAALDHPQAVRTIASGDDGGVLYLAMEYVDGVDLRELLRREGRLEPARALRLVAQAGEALDAAHAAGLVHRDVKPGNVLVANGPDGEEAYVCDFGLARHVSSAGSLTGDRGFVGTVDYVAPEQIRGGPVDGRADVYGLGCVLFECLAGERPFERESELAVVYAHLNEPPPRLTALRPGLPPAWDHVVARALAKEPDERYPTCGALAAAADDALHGRAAARPRSRRLLAGAAAALVAVAAAAVGIVLATQGSPAPRPAARQAPVLAAVDARDGRVLASLGSASRGGFGHAPSDVVVAGGSAWLLLPAEQRVLRVDTRTRAVTGSVRLPWAPLDRLAVGGGFVWAAQAGGPELARVATATGRLLATLTPGSSPPTGITAGGGSLWVAYGGTIGRVNLREGSIGYRIGYSGGGAIVYGDGALWSDDGDTLSKLSPLSGRRLARATLSGQITDVAVGGGHVWAATVPGDVVVELGERDLRVERRFPAGLDPERISFAAGRLWIANTAAGTISALDPRTGARQRLGLGALPTTALYRGGVVWTGTVPPRRALPSVAGPELRVSLPDAYITLDPAVSHSTADEELQSATCAYLLDYPDVSGRAGEQPRPEVAASMPRVSADGRTYAFRIRPGFRFSPPSGEAVSAATFKHTLERAFSPELGLNTRGAGEAPAIVGLKEYEAGRAAHVSGIRATGDTLAITLVRPEGDFLTRISLRHLCAVPLGVPDKPYPAGVPIPSAGPYYVASSSDARLVLLPNPNYGGTRPRTWGRIVYTEDIPTSSAVALADRGSVDYLFDYDNSSIVGAGEALDRRHARGFLRSDGTFLDYIVLNAGRPLFHDPAMRRAVNEALDRPALAGSYHDVPGDEIVPQSIPGFRAGTVFPVGRPDLGAARRLVGGARRHAVLYYCTLFPFGDGGLIGIARKVRANLARIGIDVSIVQAQACPRSYDSSTARADLLLVTNFGAIVHDPQPYLEMALTHGRYGSAYGPGTWTGAAFRHEVAAARALRGAARTAAYVRIARELTRAAPFAVYGTFADGSYVSTRVGCKVTNGASTLLDLVALCPRRA